MPWIFSGLTPYIQRAARADPMVTEPHLVKCEAIWHCTQLQNALGQLPKLDPRKRHELWTYVRAIRHSLAATLGGIDTAIAEAWRECPPEADPANQPPADIKAIKARRSPAEERRQV